MNERESEWISGEITSLAKKQKRYKTRRFLKLSPTYDKDVLSFDLQPVHFREKLIDDSGRWVRRCWRPLRTQRIDFIEEYHGGSGIARTLKDSADRALGLTNVHVQQFGSWVFERAREKYRQLLKIGYVTLLETTYTSFGKGQECGFFDLVRYRSPLTLMKLSPLSFAIALAKRVFPQPGGPASKIPGGCVKPSCSKCSGYLFDEGKLHLKQCV